MENEWWKLPGNLPERGSRCLRCGAITDGGNPLSCSCNAGAFAWGSFSVPESRVTISEEAVSRKVLNVTDAMVERAMAAEDEHRHSSREERVRAMLKAALG